jgi:hypothetical protein
MWEYAEGGSVTTRKIVNLWDILPWLQYSVNAAEISTGNYLLLPYSIIEFRA